METRAKVLLTGATGVVAAVGPLALTVYPLDYGVVERPVFAGAFVLATLFPTVLGDAFISPYGLAYHETASHVPVHPPFPLEHPDR